MTMEGSTEVAIAIAHGSAASTAAAIAQKHFTRSEVSLWVVRQVSAVPPMA